MLIAPFGTAARGVGDGCAGARQKTDFVGPRLTVMVGSGTCSHPSSTTVGLFSQMTIRVG